MMFKGRVICSFNILSFYKKYVTIKSRVLRKVVKMGKKKLNRKKKKKLSLCFNIIGIISAIIAIIFCIMLFFLNMLPTKYLIIIYIFIFIFYLLLLLLTFIRKIKFKFKIISMIILIVFNIIFGIGINYISKTINFVDLLDNAMYQKEEYYVMSLEAFEGSNIKDLDNKQIGIYNNTNSDKAKEKLKKEIEFKNNEYTDVVDMFDDLEQKEIDAVLISASIKNLLETELKDLKTELKEIYSFSILISQKDDIVKIVDVTRQPFNVYVAGGDAYGSIDNVTNTDVNMIVTVDPVNKKILLTSIPRDYYVNLPSYGENAYDKLTHAGYYGIEESVKAVENLLNIDINYYVKVNFSTIEGVIDAIGGIDVYSDYTFKERAFKTYTFVKGYNHLNGRQALAFARERKAFKDGDIQRVKNQQKVLKAIIDKVTSSTTIITNFSKILDSVSNSVSTNMDNKSMNRFVKMQLSDMASWDIENQNLTGTDFYTDKTYTFPNVKLYVMQKDDESINEVTDKIKTYFK